MSKVIYFLLLVSIQFTICLSKIHSYPFIDVAFFSQGKRFEIKEGQFEFIKNNENAIDTNYFRITYLKSNCDQVMSINDTISMKEFGGMVFDMGAMQTLHFDFKNLNMRKTDQNEIDCGMFYDEEYTTQIDLEFKSQSNSEKIMKFMFDFDIELQKYINGMYSEMENVCHINFHK